MDIILSCLSVSQCLPSCLERVMLPLLSIRTTGYEKLSFTLVLAITAAGTKLPSMVIFKRKTMLKEKFPKGIVVQVNEKGLMDNQMMKIWIRDL